MALPPLRPVTSWAAERRRRRSGRRVAGWHRRRQRRRLAIGAAAAAVHFCRRWRRHAGLVAVEVAKISDACDDGVAAVLPAILAAVAPRPRLLMGHTTTGNVNTADVRALGTKWRVEAVPPRVRDPATAEARRGVKSLEQRVRVDLVVARAAHHLGKGAAHKRLRCAVSEDFAAV